MELTEEYITEKLLTITESNLTIIHSDNWNEHRAKLNFVFKGENVLIQINNIGLETYKISSANYFEDDLLGKNQIFLEIENEKIEVCNNKLSLIPNYELGTISFNWKGELLDTENTVEFEFKENVNLPLHYNWQLDYDSGGELYNDPVDVTWRYSEGFLNHFDEFNFFVLSDNRDEVKITFFGDQNGIVIESDVVEENGGYVNRLLSKKIEIGINKKISFDAFNDVRIDVDEHKLFTCEEAKEVLFMFFHWKVIPDKYILRNKSYLY